MARSKPSTKAGDRLARQQRVYGAVIALLSFIVVISMVLSLLK